MNDERNQESLETGLDPSVADCIERALTASPHELELTTDQGSWREVWGALPLALDPVSPQTTTWAAIRAGLRVATTGGAGNSEVSIPANDNGWEAVASRLAAVLIVGLLVTATWLGNQVQVKNDRIAALEQEFTLSTAGFATMASVPAVSAANVGFVAADSIESCDLEAQSGAEGARGWLFMGGEEPSCFLAVEGLRPLAEDQIYHAWFRSRGRAVSLGVVEVKGDRGEMFSAGIPSNVDAVFVTVEAAGEQSTAPKGPTVLYGDSLIARL